jgi:hypothetical protein
VPGHLIGIYASVHLILQSDDPMMFTASDWTKIERALGSLKGKTLGSRRLGTHRIAEVTVSSMRPTAAAISRNARQLAARKRP